MGVSVKDFLSRPFYRRGREVRRGAAASSNFASEFAAKPSVHGVPAVKNCSSTYNMRTV